MRKLVTMREAVENPAYFGSLLAGETWRAWRILLVAIMGEPLAADEIGTFTELTGREKGPEEPVEQFWGVVGRRGGKSRAMGVLAAYLAGCCDHRDVLAPGQNGYLPILASTELQAGETFTYVLSALQESPILSGTISGRPTSDTIRLKSRIVIQVRPASWRTIRSITAIAALLDEVAFFRSDDSKNPDEEIIRALKPSLGTTEGPLIAISSPYARRGALWKTYRKHYGPAGHPRVLVAQGATRVLNPSFPQKRLDREYEEDPVGAAAEYGAQFRTDVEAFVSIEAVEACVLTNVREQAPLSTVRGYLGFVDPSGGSSDSFTLAVAHHDGERVQLDCIRETKPPFSPERTVEAYAEVLKTYKITKVRGDRYAGEWPREQFRKHGIEYEPAEQSKSDLYGALLPLINSQRVALLDDPRLVSQLVGLERRTSRAGKDSIDHAPGGHDDRVNAAAGAVVAASARKEKLVISDDILARSAMPAASRSDSPFAFRGGRQSPIFYR